MHPSSSADPLNTMPSDDDVRAAMARMDTTLTARYLRVITGDMLEGFAELCGEDHAIHLDPEFAANTRYGRRIAHGGLLLGFMSSASTVLLSDFGQKLRRSDISVGYDRIRFPAPVYEGDTITATARIATIQPERLRVLCEEQCTNQDGATVGVAVHVLQFV